VEVQLEGTGFGPGARVVVQQHSDEEWIVWESFTYTGKHETFVVPRGMCTDFASVPRPVIWYLPRYGPYTLAAILHDHLWRDLAATGQLRYVDADGIFRRAMRELEVPFLHRWVMWAAVRWGALVKPGGRDGWGDEAALVLLVTALAFPLVAVPVAAVVIALVQLWVLELATWVPLRLHAAWRRWRGRPVDKRVVFPHLDLGIGRHAAGPCPPPGWEGPPGPTSAGPGVGSGHDPTDPRPPR